MSDVLRKAALQLERGNLLLHSGFDALPLPAIPAPPVRDVPDTASDVDAVRVNVDPARLVPGTRARSLKRLLLRVLRLYTRGQVAFNAALLRVVTMWDEHLKTLRTDLTRLVHSLEDRAGARMARVDERRSVPEGRRAWERHYNGDRFTMALHGRTPIERLATSRSQHR